MVKPTSGIQFHIRQRIFFLCSANGRTVVAHGFEGSAEANKHLAERSWLHCGQALD